MAKLDKKKLGNVVTQKFDKKENLNFKKNGKLSKKENCGI